VTLTSRKDDEHRDQSHGSRCSGVESSDTILPSGGSSGEAGEGSVAGDAQGLATRPGATGTGQLSCSSPSSLYNNLPAMPEELQEVQESEEAQHGAGKVDETASVDIIGDVP